MPPNTNTEIALLKQAMDFQNKEISEIKKILVDFIESANTNFATKVEHKNNQDRIADLEKDRKNILMETVKWFIMTLLGIGVAFLMYKL